MHTSLCLAVKTQKPTSENMLKSLLLNQRKDMRPLTGYISQNKNASDAYTRTLNFSNLETSAPFFFSIVDAAHVIRSIM